jgi:hypothetical protein
LNKDELNQLGKKKKKKKKIDENFGENFPKREIWSNKGD